MEHLPFKCTQVNTEGVLYTVPGCGSGLIQSGSRSWFSIFPQSGSGSTTFLNPDPQRKILRKIFFPSYKNQYKIQKYLYYFLPLAIKMFKQLRKSEFYSSFFLPMDPDADPQSHWIRIQCVSGSGSTTLTVHTKSCLI
jgi:hypothetical protein